jgi:hypothetical protein
MWAWLVGVASGAPGAGASLPLRPCATAERLREAPRARRGPFASVGGPRAERDPYGVPNVRTSEHFAVRWGSFQPVSIADADRLLEHFELAWRVQVDEMGHTAPYGTSAFFFNVYVGDTGDGTPSSYGAGGYQTYDADGWPMVVVARNSFVDPNFLEHTAVHEFYHAIQSETARFPYDGISAWYWEATAEWAAIEAVPGNPSNGVFAPGYLWLPEIGVPAFDYPDEGTLEEYHQYGAFLFPHDLSRVVGPEVVTETWKDPSGEPDPLEVMRAAVEAAGEDLDELWLDHLAHTVLLDHPMADLLEVHLDTFRLAFPDESVVSRGLWGSGGDGKVGAEAPHRYGGYVLAVRSPDDGVLHVEVDGEATGTEGSEATFAARVVVARDAGPEYLDVPFDGASGRLDVVPDGDDVYVVVGATTAGNDRWDTERFPFAYDLWVEPPPATDDGPPPRRGRTLPRGCDTGGGAAGGAVLLAAAIARRRRATG